MAKQQHPRDIARDAMNRMWNAMADADDYDVDDHDAEDRSDVAKAIAAIASDRYKEHRWASAIRLAERVIAELEGN